MQSAEAEYKVAAQVYNERAEKISADNTKIAASAERVAQETTKAARLNNDAAYQTRRAVEAGMRISLPRRTAQSAPVDPSLSTAPIELEKPTKPAESSAAFLTRWDFWIRAANLAELLLAAATLIYIRVRSAKTNSPRVVIYDTEEEFPHSLEVENRAPMKCENFTKKKDTTETHASFNSEGLRRLREAH